MPTFPIPGTQSALGGERVFVIAEIGKNFIQTKEEQETRVYLENAKKLVLAAKEAGADAVKFQTHEVEDEQLPIDITSPHFSGSDRFSWVSRNMEATPVEGFWKPIQAYCRELDIIFFSTPMSRKAAQKLETLSVPMWKVGSGDVQDYAMLDFLIETKKPIIISSGMVSLSELDSVVQYLTSKNAPLVVLYCISQYPAPKEYFNLATITHLRKKYPSVVIGFSDHSLGDEVTLAAVSVGAKVIEKHFSFSRELWGSDHKASMTPVEFKKMVESIRGGEYKKVDASPYMGTEDRELEGATNQFRPYFNKTLVAGRDIAAGELLTSEHVYAMRPRMAGEIGSEQLHSVLGKRINRALRKYEPIKVADLI